MERKPATGGSGGHGGGWLSKASVIALSLVAMAIIWALAGRGSGLSGKPSHRVGVVPNESKPLGPARGPRESGGRFAGWFGRWRATVQFLTIYTTAIVLFVLATGLAANGLPTGEPNPTPLEIPAVLSLDRPTPLPVVESVSLQERILAIPESSAAGSLLPLLTQLLGEPFAGAVDEISREEPDRSGYLFSRARYPFSYPDIEERLGSFGSDVVARDLNDAAVAVMLSSTSRGDVVAYYLLELAVLADPALCSARMNLALVVGSVGTNIQSATELLFRRAASVCVADPTPLWMLAQHQAEHVLLPYDQDGRPFELVGTAEEAIERARLTVRDLQATHPNSSLAWEVSADIELVWGLRRQEREPFAGRRHLRIAAETYSSLAEVTGSKSSRLGSALALSALGDHDAAESVVGSVVSELGSVDGLRQALQVERAAGHIRDAEILLERIKRLPERESTGLFPGGRFGARRGASLTRSRMLDFNTDLEFGDGAGGSFAEYRPYLPQSRYEFGTDVLDPRFDDWEWLGLELALLRGEEVPGPAELDALDPELCQPGCDRPEGLLLAAGVIGQLNTGDLVVGGDQAFEYAQDLYRGYAIYEGAERVLEAWAGQVPTTPRYLDRRAEVSYLLGDYEQADEGFRLALGRLENPEHAQHEQEWSSTIVRPIRAKEILLKRAASKTSAGRSGTDREEVLLAVLDVPVGEYDFEGLYFEWHAQLELVVIDMERGDFDSAIEHLDKAMDSSEFAHSIEPSSELATGYESNFGVFLGVESGDLDEAIRLGQSAVGSDPRNPFYRQTLGYAYQSAGDLASAVAQYEVALEEDPSLSGVANDLGVAQAMLGDHTQAIESFRHAVGTDPEFALAWFNLGVVIQSESGVLRYIQAEGSFARAERLDRGLRDKERTLTVDASAYFYALDLSRPVMMAGESTHLRRAFTPAFGFLLVSACLGLFRGLVFDKVASRFAGRLSKSTMVRSKRQMGPWPPNVAFMTFVLGAAWTRLASRPVPPFAVATTAMIATGVPVAVYAVRHDLARRQMLVAQDRSSPSLVLVGFATSLAGYPLLPLPYGAQTQPRELRVRSTALTVAGLALVTFLLGAVSRVSTIRFAAGVALVAIASLMLPFPPYDGDLLASKRALWFIEVVLFVAAALSVLRLA